MASVDPRDSVEFAATRPEPYCYVATILLNRAGVPLQYQRFDHAEVMRVWLRREEQRNGRVVGAL